MESINNNNDIYDIIIENERRKWESSMINNLQPTTWETPKYSGNQIDKAGKIIADPTSSEQDRNEALEILNNWRSSHAYPLQVITSNLRRKNNNAIVVQRLKRLDSIVGKLERFPEMSLYRMQDLGGCRVIISSDNSESSIKEVYNSLNQYKNSRIRHILKRENDYIQNPKTSGYRSYHMVYQFQSDKIDTYNKNMLIEIQFRTRLQHIWATALETMGIYTKTALKASMGNKDILRFFVLVSSVFATFEKMPVCPNTSNNRDELIQEIKEIDKKLIITPKLNMMSSVIRIANDEYNNKKGYYLLSLDLKNIHLKINRFETNEIQLATNIYNKIEAENNPNIDVVLVSATSFDTLKSAYPNYFNDIHEFITIMHAIYTIM